jgi:P-type E1-E2 ATPase
MAQHTSPHEHDNHGTASKAATAHGVGLDQVVVGDSLGVRLGERVALDGAILEGRSSIDESFVTGESRRFDRERDCHHAHAMRHTMRFRPMIRSLPQSLRN